MNNEVDISVFSIRENIASLYKHWQNARDEDRMYPNIDKIDINEINDIDPNIFIFNVEDIRGLREEFMAYLTRLCIANLAEIDNNIIVPCLFEYLEENLDTVIESGEAAVNNFENLDMLEEPIQVCLLPMGKNDSSVENVVILIEFREFSSLF